MFKHPKLIAVISSAILGSIMFTGCSFDAKDEATRKVLAKISGKIAAVAWIAANNPSVEEVAAVEGTLSLIEETTGAVSNGVTYFEVIYPKVIEYINENVEAQYKPMVKLGVSSLLDALDLTFALNPELGATQDKVIIYVELFLAGAQEGLLLSEQSDVMKKIRANATAKQATIKVLKKAK